jgi:hypothetical protein
MAENTLEITLEMVGICEEFLKKYLIICSPSIKQVLGVNQVIINTCLNER